MAAVRNYFGDKVSNATTAKFAKYITILLKKKGWISNHDRVFEGQLQTKLGQVERLNAIPPKLIHIECNTSKQNTGMCTYYYIKNIPLLLEKMNAGCSLEVKFQDSIEISSLKDKIIIKFGCNRGMKDLIMQVSLGNRKNGDHGKYTAPIGVVEGATESHSNLIW